MENDKPVQDTENGQQNTDVPRRGRRAAIGRIVLGLLFAAYGGYQVLGGASPVLHSLTMGYTSKDIGLHWLQLFLGAACLSGGLLSLTSRFGPTMLLATAAILLEAIWSAKTFAMCNDFVFLHNGHFTGGIFIIPFLIVWLLLTWLSAKASK